MDGGKIRFLKIRKRQYSKNIVSSKSSISPFKDESGRKVSSTKMR